MRCVNQFEWELFLDGELPEAELEGFEKHLGRCSECKGIVDRLRQEGAFIASALAATPLAPDLAAAIERRLTATNDSAGKWLWLFTLALGPVGIFLAHSAGWFALLEKLRAVLNLFLGQGLLVKFGFTAVKIMGGLADGALKGKPVLPALAILFICMLWVQFKLFKGGSAHV
jgi:anti-sigma factor RsiW